VEEEERPWLPIAFSPWKILSMVKVPSHDKSKRPSKGLPKHGLSSCLCWWGGLHLQNGDTSGGCCFSFFFFVLCF
jgi:hypothetical protein